MHSSVPLNRSRNPLSNLCWNRILRATPESTRPTQLPCQPSRGRPNVAEQWRSESSGPGRRCLSFAAVNSVFVPPWVNFHWLCFGGISFCSHGRGDLSFKRASTCRDLIICLTGAWSNTRGSRMASAGTARGDYSRTLYPSTKLFEETNGNRGHRPRKDKGKKEKVELHERTRDKVVNLTQTERHLLSWQCACAQ